jgi:N-acetylglucosaminyldiphosphoundecaprenol N-acetyl-beta-D-mannosaminyltransferase
MAEVGIVLREVRKVDVLGIHVSAVDLPSALRQVGKWVSCGEKQYVCVTGAHGVTESLSDPMLRAVHNGSGMTVPDGMPMVWAGRFAGLREIGHVRGADLMMAVLEESARRGWRNYFYGGGEGVAETLVARLKERIPGLISVGTYCPPFRELSAAEDDEIVRVINAATADLVWVGLSTPKQERWMAAHRDRLEASVLIGVGAAFDMHAGLLPQAPQLVQRLGMEWLYRLLKEPRRLWRRYLIGHSRFLGHVLRSSPHIVRGSDASPDPAAPQAFDGEVPADPTPQFPEAAASRLEEPDRSEPVPIATSGDG